MELKTLRRSGILVALLALAMSAGAEDRSDYNRRAAARTLSQFHALDRNADGEVTRAEARNDVNFFPRFNDMETNMDGIVTKKELLRYIEQRYGVRITPPASIPGKRE
jgi:hypothetical protein